MKKHLKYSLIFLALISILGLSIALPDIYFFDLTPTNNTYQNTSTFTINVSVSNPTNVSIIINLYNQSGYRINYTGGGYNLCYQETANESTSCGGLDSGNYSSSGWFYADSLLYDGNWSSGNRPATPDHGYLYINYTKPVNSVFANWQVGTQDNASYIFNLSITSSCWNADASQISLKLDLYHQNVDFYCRNSTAWEKLYRWEQVSDVKDSEFLEEAIIWNITIEQEAYNLSATFNLSDGIYYYNATAYNSTDTNSTETRKITIDTVPPVISFVSPSELNNGRVGSRQTINVNTSVTDNNFANFTVYLSNASLLNTTVSTTNNYLITFNNLGEGVYYYNATACDKANFCRNSSTRTVTVDLTPPNVSYIPSTPVQSSNISTSYMFINMNTSETDFWNATYVLYDGNTSISQSKYPLEDIGISAGYIHTCIVKRDGAVYCEGSSSNNKLIVDNSASGVKVSSGYGHTCYVNKTGEIICQSSDSFANGVFTFSSPAVQVSAANSYTCVLLVDGTTRCWGTGNSDGRLWNSTTGTAVQISAKYQTTCVLYSTGNVTCQGDNTYDQSINYTGGNAIQVSAGYFHTCILLSNGNVNCYGRNTDILNNPAGQAANYTGADAIQVSTGGFTTCILKNNGNTQCWGDNTYSQVYNYSNLDAIEISAGYAHTCILLSNGNAYCQGSNGAGQVFNTTTGNVRKIQFYGVNGLTSSHNYTLNGTACDTVGNCKSITSRTFSYIAPPSNPNIGSGGGGGNTCTSWCKGKNFIDGYSGQCLGVKLGEKYDSGCCCYSNKPSSTTNMSEPLNSLVNKINTLLPTNGILNYIKDNPLLALALLIIIVWIFAKSMDGRR